MSLPRVSLFQSAVRMTLTYGVLPTFEQFEDAFEGDLGEGGLYEIRNCKRVGNDSFTCEELWCEIMAARDESQADEGEWADAAGDWASAVLGTLGIEWV